MRTFSVSIHCNAGRWFKLRAKLHLISVNSMAKMIGSDADTNHSSDRLEQHVPKQVILQISRYDRPEYFTKTELPTISDHEMTSAILRVVRAAHGDRVQSNKATSDGYNPVPLTAGELAATPGVVLVRVDVRPAHKRDAHARVSSSTIREAEKLLLEVLVEIAKARDEARAAQTESAAVRAELALLRGEVSDMRAREEARAGRATLASQVEARRQGSRTSTCCALM